MEHLIRSDLDGGIVRLSIATGDTNPLTPELIQAFADQLADLEVAPPRALMLDGGDAPLFSRGFDARSLLDYGRREMTAFVRAFEDVVARLIALPTPTVAALHGHAIAAGFVLPLGCDLRVVEAGKLQLGLGYVDLGLAVPASAQLLLAARTSPSTAARLSLLAGALSPTQAADVGYADLLAKDARKQALLVAQSLAKKPGSGVRLTKQLGSADLAERMRVAAHRGVEAFLDSWFSEEAQANLKLLAERT